jgi:hypothetical protein
MTVNLDLSTWFAWEMLRRHSTVCLWRHFQRWFSCGTATEGEEPLNVGGTIQKTGSPVGQLRLAYFLAAMRWAAFHPPCPSSIRFLPCHRHKKQWIQPSTDLSSQTMSQNKSYLFWVVFLKYFCHSDGK